MRRALLLLGTAIVFSPQVVADEKTESAPILEEANDDAVEALNEFISRAVDEGLLQRPGESTSEGSVDGKAGPVRSNLCKVVADIDFKPFRDFRGFPDLFELSESEEAFTASTRIKSHLSLGLYSEARGMLKVEGLDNSYLSKLTALLEDQSTTDTDYFSTYAQCNPEAKLWASVAKLSNYDGSGSADLEAGISVYRALPFQMKADVVSIVVPMLDSQGDGLVAKKLMSAFTDEDIKNSSGLQFSAALLDENAEKKIDQFIIRPEFRQMALSAIVQRGEALSTPQRELLLEEVTHILDHESDERQLAIALKFALDEFAKRSGVTEMMDLAKHPNLQTPAARNTIQQRIAQVVADDLNSKDQLTVLSAIQLLFDHEDAFEGHPSTANLYEVASERASAFGYKGLSQRLKDKDLRQFEGLLRQSEIAFRKDDKAQVYAIANERAESADLALYAARAALKASEKAALNTYSKRLLKHPELALRLIKEDAASEKWLVSEEIYRAAGSSPDLSIATQGANLLALRRDAKAPKKQAVVSLGTIDDILAKSTKDLRPNNKEVN